VKQAEKKYTDFNGEKNTAQRNLSLGSAIVED